VDGVNYKRGLDNRVLAKWRDGVRQRRRLAPSEAQVLSEEAYRVAEAAASASGDPRLSVLRAWDWPALEADAARFARIYRPVSILPPDQYLALVIQATEGCSYNSCTFCDFYRDRPFRIKSAAELASHIGEVVDFFGEAMGLRRSLFLADANALVAPIARVRGWLDEIDAFRRRGVLPAGGIYSFIDAFDVHRKSVDEWQELANRGLHRVYIGMETGDDALLRFLEKPGDSSDVVDAVRALKAGGVLVSLIVMTGIGGREYASQHVTNTARALSGMPLGTGDIVYFSPFTDPAGSEYGRRAAAAGIHPLPDTEMCQQETILRAALPAARAGGPQCSRYDIREFIY
jgi:radical SAM superfamily enzyme YgiQ (UPF0313 family)